MHVSSESDTRTPVNGVWDIEGLLAEAARLRPLLPPLFSWEELRIMIDSCTGLKNLRRHPQIEKLYMGHFHALVKSTFGNTESYLRERLAWDGHAKREGEIRGREFWKRGDAVLVRRNDWSYAVPNDVDHWVVWTSAPIVHPLLCISPLLPATPTHPHSFADSSPEDSPTSITSSQSTPTSPLFSPRAWSASTTPSSSGCASPTSPTSPAPPRQASRNPTWAEVQQLGLTGFSGTSKEGPHLEGFGGGADGPAREVSAFVRGRWSESEWETAWFVNPPTLQSVKLLPHFHVLAKRKAPASI